MSLYIKNKLSQFSGNKDGSTAVKTINIEIMRNTKKAKQQKPFQRLFSGIPT